MGNGLVRRTSQRQGLRRLPSRQAMNHNESYSAPATSSAPNGYHPKPQQFHDDSSEDEIPVPMKLSALTKALLNDGAPESVERPPSPPSNKKTHQCSERVDLLSHRNPPTLEVRKRPGPRPQVLKTDEPSTCKSGYKSRQEARCPFEQHSSKPQPDEAYQATINLGVSFDTTIPAPEPPWQSRHVL